MAATRSRTGRAAGSRSSASSWRSPRPFSPRPPGMPWTRAASTPPTSAGSSATRRGRAASSPPDVPPMSTCACAWTRRSSCLATCRTLTRSWATPDNDDAHSFRRRSSSVNLPIGLTLTRIVAVPLLIVFLISSSRVHALIAMAIFILASITDWADGAVARRRNQVTTLGTLLDPIADKLLVAAALVSLLAIDKIDAAYVIGAVPVGFLVARAFGIGDIRGHGSGNIGATNVLRAAGRVAALATLAGDIAKGYGAVWAGAWLAGGALAPKALCAVAAVVGNCWSVFLGFRGGKGVATGLGALLNLMPLAVLPAIPAWLAVVLTTRYVSLGC